MLYDQELIDKMLMQGYLQELLSRDKTGAVTLLGAGYVEKTSNLVQFSAVAVATIDQLIETDTPDSYPGVFWYEVPGLLWAKLLTLLLRTEWLDDTPLDFASTEQWDELLTKWADVVTVVFRRWLDGEGR